MNSLLQATASRHLDHPPPAEPRFALRLLRDLRFAALVGGGAALIITLVVGHPETLYEQLLYSCFISVTGFAIVDSARLLLWPGPARTRAQWAALVALAALTAPVVHFSAVQVVGPLFLHPTPSLFEYPTLPRLSMVVLTFMVLVAGTWTIEHRENLQRARLEHHAAQLRAETIERQAVQAQLRLLQAQIEPHMLFNTLANLQGLIAIDPDRANAMLDQLIQYLRATLGVSRAESTTLGEEFAAMEAYLGLMGVRMGERLRYRLALPQELRQLRLPPMLLQPLVENAIVHGLEPKIEGGEVTLAAERRDGLLDITVLDTGLGPGQSSSKGGGVGVSTTRERLRVLYGERASILLAPSQPQGTLVRLTLPLETA
ncbi:sensor histidine kinase [Massilia sp. IC2-477]|uniref:sensor histidine kinase n=1 Tax=Massilia sp. IC2-477 TaxID=2887198 RepID=UPI001D12647A|nr:sensor histidine kinase [Massilia sp. IC2-477]MCC2957440.1 sensor histidine kinase [Massilia sp. IC2-477]